ncbi:hypothetical protein K502DRAFT_262579 [Neoconidiobolus thromboides FSU 785]|nr:hypothetical protein K502DRAFT_262579 [Neoconidiobolus thromboides FSU 785]
MKKVTEIVKESQFKENKNEILGFLLFMFSAYTTTVTLNVYSVWNFDILHHLLLQLLSAVFYLFFKLNGNQLRLKAPAKVDLIKENPEEEKILKDNLEEEIVLTDKPKESIINGRLNKEKEDIKINKAPVHKYTPMIEELTTEFLNNVKTPIAHQPELWENIVSLTYPMELTVSRHKKLAHCYTMTTIFDNTPANVFDIFNSPSENGSSSGYIAVQEEIEIVDANTSIIYICTKSIWPTSARDLCVIKSSTVLKDGNLLCRNKI